MNKEETKNTKIASSSILQNVIANIDPIHKQRTENRMYMAAKIQDLLEEKGLRKKDLAQKLGKRPSEITKWLSGSHNFTLDTLSAIGRVLNINLIQNQVKI